MAVGRTRHRIGDLRIVLLAFVLGLVSAPVVAGVAIVSGHAGHWYALERDGEGWVLEFFDAGRALLYWFTYDDAGGQRWLTAVGQVVADADGGERIEFPQLVASHGARFGAGFDPDDVIREDVGSATLRFENCDHGHFSYDAYGEQHGFPVLRLARLMAADCESLHGVAGRDIASHAGQSGSWYDPARDGEGIALQWLAPDQAIVTWYSYDLDGDPYWLLGTGRHDGDGVIRFDDLHTTRGARFGTAFDPADIERIAWGTLSLVLDCDTGELAYESQLPGFGSGGFPLQRLTRADGIACPWQPPALQDLYALTLNELPTSVAGSPSVSVYPQFPQFAEDGSLWAVAVLTDDRRVLRLAPDADHWQPVGEAAVVVPIAAPALHRAGENMVATARSGEGEYRPVRWQDDAWQWLDEALGTDTAATGLSGSGMHVLGYEPGAHGVNLLPWRWSATEGKVMLAPAVDASNYLTVPRCAANDAAVIIGSSGLVGPAHALGLLAGVVWYGGGAPEPLVSGQGRRLLGLSACSDNADVAFGVARDGEGSPPALVAEPWYWLAEGRSGALGRLTDDGRFTYGIAGASADGTLVAGTWGIFPAFSYGASSTPVAIAAEGDPDGFVWTPHTGLVALGPVLTEAGLALPGWLDLGVVGLSADGLRLVLVGNRSDGAAPAIAVLHLSPLGTR